MKDRNRRFKIRHATGARFAFVDVPAEVIGRLDVAADEKDPRKLGEAVTRYLASHAIEQPSTR